MLRLVRQLVNYLRRWLAKWDEYEKSQTALFPRETGFWKYGIDQKSIIVKKWKPPRNLPGRLNWKEVTDFYGKPNWKGIRGSAKLAPGPGTRAWKSAHMVLVRDLPGHDRWSAKGLKKLYVNKAAVPHLTEALRRCVVMQDEGAIPKDWDLKVLQCFNPRRTGYSKTANWSEHAFGGAFDINPGTNGRGIVGSIPEGVVAAFKSCYFTWGGDYKSVPRDDMHFGLWS